MFKCAARTDSLPEQSPFISFLLCSETLYKVSVLFVSSSSLPLRVLGKALKFWRYISWIYVTKSTHDIVGLGKVASQERRKRFSVSLVLYRNTDNLSSNRLCDVHVAASDYSRKMNHYMALITLKVSQTEQEIQEHNPSFESRLGFLFCKLKAQQPYSCPDWLLQLLGPLSPSWSPADCNQTLLRWSVARSQGLGAKTCK